MQVRFLPGALVSDEALGRLKRPCYGPRVLVTESTLETASGVAPRPAATPSVRADRSLLRRRPWWIVGVAVVAVSVVLVEWARTRPGFDPYGWLVWGHQTINLSLDTNAAPSWKPLPYLFTVPFALFGSHAQLLWMVASAAVALSGVVFAGRIAYKLTAAPPQRRWAAILAGVFAGAALLGIENYSHYILSSQSDPMIVALCLGAIDCHLNQRPRAAFVLGALASLGRPEVWAFLGLYSIWAWVRRPGMRTLLVGGWVVIALLWFGIPAITSRTPFVAASNAMDSGRRLTNNQVFGTIGRFLGITEAPIELAALLAVVLAAWRRDRETLVLAAAVVLWVVIEIAFALHGWPGLARYMFEPAGILPVLAGVAVGRLLADRPVIARLPAWAGPALVVVLVASLVPAGISHARVEHKDLKIQRARTDLIGRLNGVVGQLGGPGRLAACGEPLTRLEYQTVLAYTLKFNVSRVGFKYSQSLAHGNPVVLFTPTSRGGWLVEAAHQVKPSCRSLPQLH